ncbi:hypothetical protein D5S19_19965 [Amycolatopsis panacis]|uniref:Uncharacterized protein n=1 Tax=Amycolatopsis panacis TaxID=2340917 RepID=A0A419I1D2_9PSEU|nr:hypothetical protein D5S19_19965 [Amycolatopsis panacis]
MTDAGKAGIPALPLFGGGFADTSGSPSNANPDREFAGRGLLGGVFGIVDLPFGNTLNGLLDHTLSTVHNVAGIAAAATGRDGIIAPLLPFEDFVGRTLSGGSGSGSATVLAPSMGYERGSASVPQNSKASVTTPATTSSEVGTSLPFVIKDAKSFFAKVVHEPVEKQVSNERTPLAGGGNRGGGGLPAAPGAPSAPVTVAGPGLDGPGGARLPFAVAADGNTVTQLKLIGVSRDREAAGAGRDAALPNTSPD